MSGLALALPQAPARLRILCIVSFLNEAQRLPACLRSIAQQERFPDQLLLIDDGSDDDSARIAAEFASEHDGVRVLRRPPRPPARDRLALAAELRSFQWALEQAADGWDVAGKLDADLELSSDLLATLERAFLADPALGVAGAYLSVRDSHTGSLRRERCPPQHVRGATKFYRRACLEAISPVPAILGWDTIDEVAARRHGWRTSSVECRAGDTIHLRPTGSSDGRIRAHHRWGACAYGIGQHPLWVALSAVRRVRERPYVIGSLAFLAGWASAALHRRPRAPSDVRAFVRREQLGILAGVVRQGLAA